MPVIGVHQAVDGSDFELVFGSGEQRVERCKLPAVHFFIEMGHIADERAVVRGHQNRIILGKTIVVKEEGDAADADGGFARSGNPLEEGVAFGILKGDPFLLRVYVHFSQPATSASWTSMLSCVCSASLYVIDIERWLVAQTQLYHFWRSQIVTSE